MKLPFVALLLLFAFGIGILILPQASFSEMENRALSTWQSPSLRTLADGSFFRRLQSVYTDQFPMRTILTAGKASIERWLGKQENNGILWGKDGYLIPKNEVPDLTVAERNLAALARFTETSELPLTTLLIPRSVDVMSSFLPSLYDSERSTRVLHLAEQALPTAVLPLTPLRSAAEQGEAVWYKTDHHWTTHGAYLSYVALADVMGFTPYPEDFFEPQTVSSTFLGTSYSTVGCVAEEADSIVLYRYATDSEFLVRNGETGETRHGFYDLSALTRKDQYRVFLGGNTGHLTIRRPSDTEKKPRLLWIKDSFSNALVPFLALHFDIDLIDPRYDVRSIREWLTANAYDSILIEQGLDTLATDPSISRMVSATVPTSPS